MPLALVLVFGLIYIIVEPRQKAAELEERLRKKQEIERELRRDFEKHERERRREKEEKERLEQEKNKLKRENEQLHQEVGRKNKLQTWLWARGSNLDASALWKCSKIYNMDYHLVIAVAFAEQGGYADSSIGWNYWGWNHPDGAARGDVMGSSPAEAIYNYYEALRGEGYEGKDAAGFKAKGYATSDKWLGNVNHFLWQMERAEV